MQFQEKKYEPVIDAFAICIMNTLLKTIFNIKLKSKTDEKVRPTDLWKQCPWNFPYYIWHISIHIIFTLLVITDSFKLSEPK